MTFDGIYFFPYASCSSSFLQVDLAAHMLLVGFSLALFSTPRFTPVTPCTCKIGVKDAEIPQIVKSKLPEGAHKIAREEILNICCDFLLKRKWTIRLKVQLSFLNNMET